jgi:riboflavin kinase
MTALLPRLAMVAFFLLSQALAFTPSSPAARTLSRGARCSLSSSTRLFSGSPEPLDRVIRLRGKIDAGYGRGGKKLGFPTANLPSSLFQNALEEVPTGVYMGWALIEGDASGRGVPQKAAVNVGYSPTFEGKENKEKIVEAHLILEEDMTDFYDEVMRLSLIGFLRPEKKFDSFPDLMAAITNDVTTAKESLEENRFVSFKSEPFLSSKTWVGTDGGDDEASWEFQDWTR